MTTAERIREAERAMLDAEGPFYVDGRYISDAALASRVRYEAAAYAVREADRRAAVLARLAARAARPVTATEARVA
jgi:hypothetical protein